MSRKARQIVGEGLFGAAAASARPAARGVGVQEMSLGGLFKPLTAPTKADLDRIRARAAVRSPAEIYQNGR